MRNTFHNVFFLLLLLANHAYAQSIPEVVDKFEDTRALYSRLQNMQLLLSSFQVKELRGFSIDPWHSFLKTHGEDIIDQEMKEFVNNPRSQDHFMATDPATKQIAAKMVEEYAKFQNANDHIAAVNEHMRGPNDAAHLLVD